MEDSELTDAARLYLKDIDVLEVARAQLSDYCEFCWRCFQREVPLVQNKTFEHAGNLWAGTNDGAGRCTYFESLNCVLKLGVCDPLFAGDRFFQVWLWCHKSDRQKLEKGPGLEVFDSVASVRGVRLDFGSLTELWTENLPVLDDPSAMGQRLASALRHAAEHAVAFQAELR